MTGSRLLWLALAFGCAGASVACAGIFGFEHLSEAPADASDNEAGGREGDCIGRLPPELPDAELAGVPIVSASDEPISFAVRAVHFDDTAEPPGFNLDRKCTRTPAQNGCITHAGADFSEFGVDGDGGVDNAFASLPKRLQNQFPGDAAPELSAQSLTEKIRDGRMGALVQLRAWNGTSEDSAVQVEFQPALGVWIVLPGAAHAGEPRPGGMFFSPDEAVDAGVAALPNVEKLLQRVDVVDGGWFVPGGVWGDGGVLFPGGPPSAPPAALSASDLWMPDARFSTRAITPHAAYVTHGTLVAKFEVLKFPIRMADDRKMFDVDIDDAVIVADLVADPASPKGVNLENMVLAGTWRASKLLQQVLTLSIPGGFVCRQDDDQFQVVACRRNDSLTKALQGDAPEGKDCDAISVGVAFETYNVDSVGPPYDQSRQFRSLDGGFDGPISPNVLDPRDRCPVSLDASCIP